MNLKLRNLSLIVVMALGTLAGAVTHRAATAQESFWMTSYRPSKLEWLVVQANEAGHQHCTHDFEGYCVAIIYIARNPDTVVLAIETRRYRDPAGAFAVDDGRRTKLESEVTATIASGRRIVTTLAEGFGAAQPPRVEVTRTDTVVSPTKKIVATQPVAN